MAASRLQITATAADAQHSGSATTISLVLTLLQLDYCRGTGPHYDCFSCLTQHFKLDFDSKAL